jgi:hypothetical protein
MSVWSVLQSVLIGVGTLVVVGRYGLRLVSLGNPLFLAERGRLYLWVKAMPATTVFRWTGGEGLQMVVYDADADAERTHPVPFSQSKNQLTFLRWNDRPRSAAFVLRRIEYDWLFRAASALVLFAGTFALLVWLAVAVSWYWWAAVAFLAVHQRRYFRTGISYYWAGKGPYIIAVGGVPVPRGRRLGADSGIRGDALLHGLAPVQRESPSGLL